MTKTAFIFDLDGVLVDTTVFHFKAWQNMARKLGFEINQEFNETLKGISRMDSLNRILDFGGIKLSMEEKERFAFEKNEEYLKMVSKMTNEEILPGVENFLKECKKIDIPMAVGSASKNARVILEKTGLDLYFDAIIDGNAVKNSKPNPKVFKKAADLLDAEPKYCVVFEDAPAGIEAALNAQMIPIGIGSDRNLNLAFRVYDGFENLKPQDFLSLNI